MSKYDEDQCSCHINPPCGYCTSHCECVICGKKIHNDDAVYVKGPNVSATLPPEEFGPMCKECSNKEGD